MQRKFCEKNVRLFGFYIDRDFKLNYKYIKTIQHDKVMLKCFINFPAIT